VAKWWRILEEKFGGGPGAPKRLQTIRWLFILAGIGAIIMIVSSFLQVKEIDPLLLGQPSSGAPVQLSQEQPTFQQHNERNSPFAEIESAYEQSLKEILAKMVGVGAVEVLVTVESTEEIVADRNTTKSHQVTKEQDKDGASRHITQTSESGEIVMVRVSGADAPVVRKTIRPVIRGVIIVAEGAENMTIKKLILESVERGLGVPPHRISIVPGKR
jgi:stage III sporulation protein AG